MANKIQLRRDTTANWNNVNPILADGEPGLDITTNQIKYGDGANAWVDLSYASGGGGLTDVDGVVTFPGDLLIGTLWPEGGDKESVVWAKDDTEYLGLWWGGSQTYPENGYGPVAGIMIGNVSATDDFTSNASPEGTNVTIGINDLVGDTLEWIFDRDGNFSLPNNKGYINTSDGSLDIVSGSNVPLNITVTQTNNGDGRGIVLHAGSGIDDGVTARDGGAIELRTGMSTNNGESGRILLSTTDNNHFERNWQLNSYSELILPNGAKIKSTDVLPMYDNTTSVAYYNYDASSMSFAAVIGDTVNFPNFSGQILINDHLDGQVELWLCGGGPTFRLGTSKDGTVPSPTTQNLGSIAINGGINGYTWTCAKDGTYVFVATRTRNTA